MSETIADNAAPQEMDWFLSLATTAWSIGRQLRRDIALQLAPEGITAEDFLTLHLLQTAQNGVSQVELAELLGISTAQTSGLVERVRQRGWITPHRDPQDRRRQCWIVTNEGRAEDQRLLALLQPLALISARGLALEDGRRLVQLLGQVTSLEAASATAVPSTDNTEARRVA
jgi:DNA-binding MarR family transcriptional regulator